MVTKMLAAPPPVTATQNRVSGYRTSARPTAATADPFTLSFSATPVGQPAWWYEIVEGLPDPIVKEGFIDVAAWTRPGIGLDFNIPAARAHLREEDRDFFD